MSEVNFDIVACIDVSGGMARNIYEVKKTVISLHSAILNNSKKYGPGIMQFRIKVIAFRDYLCDEEPMVESQFFTLPIQENELQAFLDGLETTGGGDMPENSLEAIALAMKSDWVPVQADKKARHMIILFTDAPPVPLGEREDCPNYPTNIPKNIAELSAWWEGAIEIPNGTYSSAAGRFIAVVPQDEAWMQLEAWNRFFPIYIDDLFECDKILSEISFWWNGGYWGVNPNM